MFIKKGNPQSEKTMNPNKSSKHTLIEQQRTSFKELKSHLKELRVANQPDNKWSFFPHILYIDYSQTRPLKLVCGNVSATCLESIYIFWTMDEEFWSALRMAKQYPYGPKNKAPYWFSYCKIWILHIEFFLSLTCFIVSEYLP